MNVTPSAVSHGLSRLRRLFSLTRDSQGFVDEALAALTRSRRVAVAVPNFMFALTLVAETDLLASLPRALVETHARRFCLVLSEAPMTLRTFSIRAVTTKSAMTDAGVAWLFRLLERTAVGG